MDKEREAYLNKYSAEILQNFKAQVVSGKSEKEAAELSGCSLYELTAIEGASEAREWARKLASEAEHAKQLVILKATLAAGFKKEEIKTATGLTWPRATRRNKEFRGLIDEKLYTSFYKAKYKRKKTKQDDAPDFKQIGIKIAVEAYSK